MSVFESLFIRIYHHSQPIFTIFYHHQLDKDMQIQQWGQLV